ncbi:MAG: hypothetical protein JXA15_04315 [Spirochaetales bacterium]|nr:hypothetical protein [Spirochaetales bacterium]
MAKGVSAVGFQRFALGLFFVVLGLTGILPSAGESFFGFTSGHTTAEVVFGVVELLCGLFLLADVFLRIPDRTSATVIMVILVLWLARVGYVEVYQGISFRNDGVRFSPNFWNWALAVSTDLVIASGLWALWRSEAR